MFTLTSFKEPALSSCSQAGMVNNLNDGLAWGIFPLFFAQVAGLSVGRIGVLAALYPAVWGIGQLFTGAWSDRVGRKWLIAGGMWAQAAAIGLIAASSSFGLWALGAVLLGAGTAMVYPTLLAAVGDVAHPAWRASAVGVYRLWRDAGFAVGALLAGIVADALRHARRDLDRRRPHRGIRRRRRAAHVRNAPPDPTLARDPSAELLEQGAPTMTETQNPPVDVDALRAEVRDKYRAVAVAPDAEYHFHTGRRLAAKLGYDPEVVDALPDAAVESFAGVGNPFSIRTLEPG